MNALDHDVDLVPLREVAGTAVVAASASGVRQVGAVGTAAADTRFRIASLTKPITAAATVLAAKRAGVELKTPVLEVLPDLRRDWAADRDVTVVDVLSQTSGLAASVTARDIARLGDADTAIMEAARLVARAGSVRRPGRAWEYYNGNYYLAGAIIASLSGTTYEHALDDLILRPWGLAATSFDVPAGLVPGVERNRKLPQQPYPRGRRPSGGLCSTAGDLLTFAERLVAHADLLAQVRAVRTRRHDPTSYGLGWAVAPSGQLYHNGRLAGYRAALLLVPDRCFAGVALAADSGALAAEARILSDLQQRATGDDLAQAIETFAS